MKDDLHLSRETRERVVAVALRDEITSQAAIRRALELGLRQLEVGAHHDELQCPVDGAKRTEVQRPLVRPVRHGVAIGRPVVAPPRGRREGDARHRPGTQTALPEFPRDATPPVPCWCRERRRDR